MNHAPKVSILLPNLNNRQFLEERMKSIINQTLMDWELIICDSYSDDGSWEYLQSFSNDNRVRLYQIPRQGIYAGINESLKRAQGEYVYIATSDDTMLPKCLEKMVKVLDACVECDICHTILKGIDQEGKELLNWWYRPYLIRLYGDWIDKEHIRLAPYDGLLHCALGTIYTSLTQLLIRRTVFNRVGLFRSDWGSMGDFEWAMRASLVCNVFHLPERLATWRQHSQQATEVYEKAQPTYDRYNKLCVMVKAAMPILRLTKPGIYKKVNLKRLLYCYRRQQFRAGLNKNRVGFRRLVFFLSFFLFRPDVVFEYLAPCLFRLNKPEVDEVDYVKAELARLNLDSCIVLPKEMKLGSFSGY